MKGPLADKRILVTRPAELADVLSGPLANLGAVPVLCPTIAIVPPQSYAGLDAAIADVAGFDMLVLTSANAVTTFFSRLAHSGRDVAALKSLQIVAVGPKTAAAIAGYGVKAELVPEDYQAEGVVAMLQDQVQGKRLLYPKAALARDLIVKELSAHGATVVAPDAYSSAVPPGSAAVLHRELAAGLDLITLTASSTVRNLVELARPEDQDALRAVPAASIGPITTTTCRELGFHVVIEPKDSTIDALIDAIVDYYNGTRDAERGTRQSS